MRSRRSAGSPRPALASAHVSRCRRGPAVASAHDPSPRSQLGRRQWHRAHEAAAEPRYHRGLAVASAHDPIATVPAGTSAVAPRPRGRSRRATLCRSDPRHTTTGLDNSASPGEEMRASSWTFGILFKRTKSLIVAVGPVGAVGKRAPGWPGVLVRGCPRAEGNHLPCVRVPAPRPRGCPRPGRVHRPPRACTALAFWRCCRSQAPAARRRSRSGEPTCCGLRPSPRLRGRSRRGINSGSLTLTDRLGTANR